MEHSPKEAHLFALKKTTNWQSLLLVVMGLFYMQVLLLAVGEFGTERYWHTNKFILMLIVGVGLAWIAYIWVNLLQSILATKAYLRSSKEDDLQRAYKKQRLFWRNIVIIAGLFVGLIAFIFMVILITSRGRF